MSGTNELYRKIFCSICEHLTCDSCFVPEFSRFIHKVEKQEDCILCSQPTPHRMGEPVYNRRFYIEGVGQLCETCYEKGNDT